MSDLHGGLQTLQDAGYQDGDVIPILSVNSPDSAVANVSSGTFQSNQSWIWQRYFDFADIAPSNGQLVGALSALYVPGTDETLYARIRNHKDSETIVSDSSAATESRWTGWVDYTPSSRTGNGFRLEIRGDPAVDQSTLKNFHFYLGVRL